MKFAQQLQQGAVEEWRRAYVDYRLLKKLIKAAAKSQEATLTSTSGQNSALHRALLQQSPAAQTPDSSHVIDHASSEEVSTPRDGLTPTRVSTRDSIASSGRAASFSMAGAGEALSNLRKRRFSMRPSSKPPTMGESRWRYPPDVPLEANYPRMTPQERKFFAVLDKELEKVEHFYSERETEALDRYKVLREQLDQLAEHRQEYLAQHGQPSKYIKPIMGQMAFARPMKRPSESHATQKSPSDFGVENLPGNTDLSKLRHLSNGGDSQMTATHVHDDNNRKTGISAFHYHPENYVAARRKLKLAVYEFYKYLGYLKNYRLLNRTCFSKATKKMEKMTNIKCQGQYMEKVSQAPFSCSGTIDDLQSQTETMFGTSFEKGSRKKAIQRLRFMGAAATTHHFSVWRAGLFLGLAIPPFVDGLVKACHPEVIARIPARESLLQLWGAFFLPVLLSFGIGLNLVGWSAAHINVPLVFYFDARTHIDFRQFIEIPSLLLCMLGYCFWLSFTVVSDTVSPQAWPLVWLFAVIALLFNPLPIYYPHARTWLIRSTTRVFSAGLVRVQFRDFWLGDQFVSLYYVSYNLGLLVCAYKNHFSADTNAVCSTNATWASPILASLPSIWRLGQSIRRYADSREVPTHLVNAGKYSAGILYFFVYFNWRITSQSAYDFRFALFIAFAIINSTYSLVWDLLMDWGLMRRNSKHFLLRDELAWRRSKWLYYVAIAVDICLRFTWVAYIPSEGSVRLRGFIIAVVETLRRWMWNFIRVESEHIGNVDGFRVTRDVPLPYMVGHPSIPSEHVDDEDDLHPDILAQEKSLFSGKSGMPLAARRSKFHALLPGEVGKRLKTAIFGGNADPDQHSDVDEGDSSNVDDESVPTDAKRPGRPQTKHADTSPGVAAVREQTTDRAGLVVDSRGQNLRNYNTFGWDSDVEALNHPPAAHTH